MYDKLQFGTMLKAAGFASVRKCTYGNNPDPMLDAVEDPDRFFEDGFHELGIEERKP